MKVVNKNRMGSRTQGPFLELKGSIQYVQKGHPTYLPTFLPTVDMILQN